MTARDPLPLPSTLLLPDRKGLARHQLNLPIVRSPISLQTSRLPEVNNGCSPTYLVGAGPKVNAVDTTTICSPVISKDKKTNNNSSSSSSSSSTCTDTEQDLPASRPIRITLPRQPVVPKVDLHIQVPEISPRFCVPPSASRVATTFASRRVSWSPTQAIPGGHYSKGFTLTSTQKSLDTTTGHSHSTPSSSCSSYSSSTAVRRTNTQHSQRKKSLTPFRRLVGRSKSMKAKNLIPFFVADNEITPSKRGAIGSESDYASSPNMIQSNSRLGKTSKVSLDMILSTPTAMDVVNGAVHATLQPPTKNIIDGHDVSTTLPTEEKVTVSKDSGTAKGITKEATESSSSRPAVSKSTVISNIPVSWCKPLWRNTRTNAEEIQALGLSNKDIQKQETIFELIYTESEYLDDLKTIHRVFVEELNIKMAEARRKKRSNPDKADIKLYERLARLLSHIKDLWNGHQSLLTSLQQKQKSSCPVVKEIGSVFESFYMFSIYDSYFAQYTITSKDFPHIMSGTSELCLIIKDILRSPRCKSLALEGIFLKPIQRLQKYPLFFKDIMGLTARTDPDYVQLQHALSNHQRELTKIDDRIWIDKHNEMLIDLQQRIKGLPSNFSLVEQHRYLILDGPVYRITARQSHKPLYGKSRSSSKSEGSGQSQSLPSPPTDWREGFRSPVTSLREQDNTPTVIHRPSQLEYHHLHSKPAFPSHPPSSSSSSSTSSSSSYTSSSSFSSVPTSPNVSIPSSRSRSYFDSQEDGSQRTSSLISPTSPPSATTLTSISSSPGDKMSPVSSPNSKRKQLQPTVSQLVAQYNFHLSSSFSSLTGTGGHPRNMSSSALHLPGAIKNPTDTDSEYHVFVFTDIVLWTKRVISRYNRKEGTPWSFKLVEPVSRLTSVSKTTEDNIFMCTSVNTSSTSYLVRTEDEIAARMWRTTIPTLVPFHCSRNLKDKGKR